MALNPRPNYNPDHVTMMDSMTGTIPTEQLEGIITDIKHGSAFMKLAKAVPMTKPIKQFTHLSGVGAYWVNETERIRTSKPTWLSVEMRAYKLGVIIPVSQETLDYSMSNFFELMKPEIAEAFAKKFDIAAFSGVDTPYQKSIYSAATDAGNVLVETSNKYDDINNAMAFIEENDLEPNAIATTRRQRSKYRATKDSADRPIFNQATAGGVDDILGLPVAYFPKNTTGDDNIAELVGDWNNAYYGILQNIRYKILDQGSLTTIVADDGGEPLNLGERDMLALRATMEIGMMVVKDEAFAAITKSEGSAPENQSLTDEAETDETEIE